MFGKSRIGDSVAAEMDRILGDAEFQSVFAKPELTDDYSQALAQDASYQAFVRVASKKDKDDDDEVGKDDKKKKSKARPPWLDKDDEDKDDKKDKKKEAALALEYIVESLNKTSEVLDNLGFDKSATVALALINGIYREASVKLAQDPGVEERVADLKSQKPGDLLLEGEDEPQEPPSPSIGEPRKMPEIPEDPSAPEEPDFPEEPDAEPMGPYGDLFADDEDMGASNCGSMMASASDKSKDKEKDKEKAKKDCVAFAKKCMKENDCKGTAKATDNGIEVHCKGEKAKCDPCCKEIAAFCKKHKVSCKITKEYTDKKNEKKAFVIRNKAVLAAMNELNEWLKEG